MERIPRRESCAIKFPELGGHKPFGMIPVPIRSFPKTPSWLMLWFDGVRRKWTRKVFKSECNSRSCGLIVQDLSIRHCSSPRSTPYLKVWLWWIQGLCFRSIWHRRKCSNTRTRRRFGGGVWTTLSRGTLSTLHLFHEMTLHEITLREMTPGETIPAGATGERFAPPGAAGNQDAFCMRTGAGGTRKARWRLAAKPPRR